MASESKGLDLMDISELFDTFIDAQEAGKDFPISGPLGEPTVIVMKICGPDSERLRKSRHKIMDRIHWRQRRGTYVRRGKDTEQDDNELLASAIMGWSGIIKGGELFPYSQANAEYLIRKYRFIRDQVDIFSSTRAFFDPGFDPKGKAQQAGDAEEPSIENREEVQ